MTQSRINPSAYSLATGEAAVRRLSALHRISEPAGRRILLRAGLEPGMHVADFGCGVGATTRMLAEMVGPSGSVTGIDLSAFQLEEGRRHCAGSGITNATFVESSALSTGMPDESFDLVYSRFLMIHLADPLACLQEKARVLKPGGILVVEDADLTSAGSIPASSLDRFSELFARLGPIRGVDYALGTRLYHLVRQAGFVEPDVEIYQAAVARGDDRFVLKWTVEEAAIAFIEAGLATADELRMLLAEMDRDTRNSDVLVLPARVFQVWARKGR